MDKIIYISPEDLGSLTGISNFANSPNIIKLLDPVNYHFILFSTLYQSGANYFQTYREELPTEIKHSNFWNEKLINIDKKAYEIAKSKAVQILDGKLNINLDDARGKYLKIVTEIHLANLFYATQTRNSFVSVHNSLESHLDILKKGMDKELWISLKNLSTLIKAESIPTIAPKFSILKNDVKRFEDISYSKLFRDYHKSISLIEHEHISKAKKEISSMSLRLFNKYGNYLSLNDTVFNFIKFGKKIIDSFISIVPPFVSDFLIASAETMMKNKRTIRFYELKEINYQNILVNRIEEIFKVGGDEKFKEIVEGFKAEKNGS